MDFPGRSGAAGMRGAVLFLCLVLLLVLGVIGTSALETSVLEVRLARNHQDVQTAFQAAEAALRQGEAVVAALDDDAATAVDGGSSWRVAMSDHTFSWRDPAVWRGPGTGASGAGRYLIERLAAAEDERTRLVVFRVTARGVGRHGDVHVLLQSTYGHAWWSVVEDEAVDRDRLVGLPVGRLSWREVE
jgi:type IV pilus assembly protein PilX